MSTIGRRRIVLIEKTLPTKYHKHTIPEIFQPLITPIFQGAELFTKNNFNVELEMSDGSIIDEFRIRGFKIDSNGTKKILKIKTLLHIKEWLDDYSKIVIARIVLFDSIGNNINTLDLDIQFDGYSFECDYGADGHMIPCFTYTIVGD